MNATDDKWTLVQVMAWCRQATSHYLSQFWPSFLKPYGVTRPQWVILQLFCLCLRVLTPIDAYMHGVEKIPHKTMFNRNSWISINDDNNWTDTTVYDLWAQWLSNKSYDALVKISPSRHSAREIRQVQQATNWNGHTKYGKKLRIIHPQIRIRLSSW